MEQIKEIDMDKYIVIKRDDLRYLSMELKAAVAQIVANINHKRKVIDNKKPNQYLVLNMEDEFDLTWLSCELNKLDDTISRKTFIYDIAVELVNAILKVK